MAYVLPVICIGEIIGFALGKAGKPTAKIDVITEPPIVTQLFRQPTLGSTILKYILSNLFSYPMRELMHKPEPDAQSRRSTSIPPMDPTLLSVIAPQGVY